MTAVVCLRSHREASAIPAVPSQNRRSLVPRVAPWPIAIDARSSMSSSDRIRGGAWRPRGLSASTTSSRSRRARARGRRLQAPRRAVPARTPQPRVAQAQAPPPGNARNQRLDARRPSARHLLSQPRRRLGRAALRRCGATRPRRTGTSSAPRPRARSRNRPSSAREPTTRAPRHLAGRQWPRPVRPTTTRRGHPPGRRQCRGLHAASDPHRGD